MPLIVRLDSPHEESRYFMWSDGNPESDPLPRVDFERWYPTRYSQDFLPSSQQLENRMRRVALRGTSSYSLSVKRWLARRGLTMQEAWDLYVGNAPDDGI